MTDGASSRDADKTVTYAEEARKNGVVLFAIGQILLLCISKVTFLHLSQVISTYKEYPIIQAGYYLAKVAIYGGGGGRHCIYYYELCFIEPYKRQKNHLI